VVDQVEVPFDVAARIEVVVQVVGGEMTVVDVLVRKLAQNHCTAVVEYSWEMEQISMELAEVVIELSVLELLMVA
jgi:hypothetical protein